MTLAQRAKDEGLPVKIGLEVDYYADQMDVVSPLLAQYPFDVLIGSVHWLGTWQFDDYDVPTHAHEWTVRDVDQCWADYARAIDELAASNSVDVLAHPDLIKVAGYIASDPGDWWDAHGRVGREVRSLDGVLVGGVDQASQRAVSGRGIPRSPRGARASRSRRPVTHTHSSASARGPGSWRISWSHAACTRSRPTTRVNAR